MAHILGYFGSALTLLAMSGLSQAQEVFRNPVEVVAANTIEIAGAAVPSRLPFYANRGLDTPNPEIDRAVIVIHGRLRNAGTYFQSALTALEASGEERSRTLLIAPQFLARADGAVRALPDEVLRWDLEGWQSGEDAIAPAPLSSFDVMDFILHRLSNRALFPALRNIVIAGHGAGGQVVQGYALLGRGEDALARQGVHVRYAVANSPSYAYFDARRPDGAGHFLSFAAGSCPDFNHWHYGMDHLPRYAGAEPPSVAEERYIKRDVVYLLGAEDTDPNHRAIDKSCMAEAQGAARLSRGEAYFAYLNERHPRDLAHRLVHISGIGHDADRVLASECGMAVLFGRPGCSSC